MQKLPSGNVPKPHSKVHSIIPLSYDCPANSYLDVGTFGENVVRI
jgi:hypothetical protein